MDIGGAFPSNYIKAADLKGRSTVVEIDRVEFEPVGKDKEMKPVVYFAGKEKGMVLNKTNASKIVSITGSSQTEDWAGSSILIYPTETEFAGETVDCVRIKPVPAQARASQRPAPMPVEQEQPAAPLTDDDIPF
jgi:hypothetical protein